MARTATVAKATTRPAIEKKALAESNKSAGMRMLFDAGYSVTRVQAVFNAPYGYVYGVALRHGVIATAANRRVSKATVKVTKVAKKAVATTKSKVSAAATRVAKASTAKAKPGRPTPARRAANRRARSTQTA